MSHTPATQDPPTPWVELRIHGVSGTPPEVMLESAHVKQVAGDSWGRFFRPTDGRGQEYRSTPEDIPPGRTLEGYHWGKYTSSSWVKGLWLVLIPFGLVNAAAFMVPRPGKRWHWLYVTVQSVIRVIGVGVTCTFALASGLMLVDLVAWQWAPRLPWLQGKIGPTLAACVILAGAVIYALHWLGDRNRKSPFDPAEADSLAARTSPRTGLLRYEFFHVNESSQPTLGRLHLCAGWSVAALIGALTWETIDTAGNPLGHPGLEQDVRAWSLFLLAASAVLVAVMGDPNIALEAGRPGPLQPLVTAGAVLLEILAGLNLVGSAALLWSAQHALEDHRPTGVKLDFDAYSQWLATAAGVGLVVLAALLALLGAVTAVDRTKVPRSFRRYAGGMAAWGATSAGVFLGVGFCAAFVLGLAHALGAKAQTELIYRVVYCWGWTVVFVALVAALTWVLMWRRAGVSAGLVAQEYGQAQNGLVQPLPGWRPADTRRWLPWRAGRVAWAMSRARLKLHVAWMILLYAVFGWVLTAVTTIEMLGESNKPGARHWYHHLGLLGRLSETVPTHGHGTWWVQLLSNLGTYTLIGVAGLLFSLGRRSLRASGTRRGANVFWDVISFWPHASHPFVPTAYSQFAVHDLRRRIRFHLGLPPVPIRGEQDPEVSPDAPVIVLSAHSQGSLLAFTTLLWLSEAEREHVRLVTYGSQLQVAYPRAFPSFVSVELVQAVLGALQGRWINLYRETDPIAGPVLSWDRTRMVPRPGSEKPASCRFTWQAPDKRAELSATRVEDTFVAATGRRESGLDWRVLDPPPIDPQLQSTTLTALRQHSGYPASADYLGAVQALLVSTPAGWGRSARPRPRRRLPRGQRRRTQHL